MVRGMVMASLSLPMGISIRGTGSMISARERESLNMQVALCTMACGKKGRVMGMEFGLSLMARDMRGISRKAVL